MWRRPRSKPSSMSVHGQRRVGTPALVLVILIVAITVLILYKNYAERPTPPFRLANLKWDRFRPSVELRPSVASVNGTDAIWQVPTSPKAALFLAHGCSGRAANFWDRYPGCPDCVGLPEERLVVLHALHRGFAVLAVSSLGKCWSFEETGRVKRIIEWWVRENRLEKLPLVALGASSGGYFVSALATELKFSSITLMIAEGVFDGMPIPDDYPPTLFVHMPKDRNRMRMVRKNMEALKKKGVPVKEIRCMEFPLTPTLLSNRIPGLDRTFSVKLFELFRDKGFIDERGYMRNDGRVTRWKQALKESKLALENNELVSHIQEEMNLAFAYHEMTSLQMEDILEWFESHMS